MPHNEEGVSNFTSTNVRLTAAWNLDCGTSGLCLRVPVLTSWVQLLAEECWGVPIKVETSLKISTISQAKLTNTRRRNLEAAPLQQIEGENAQTLFDDNAHTCHNVDN